MEQSTNAWTIVILGLAINCILSIVFIALFGYVFLAGMKIKGNAFQPIMLQLIQVRERVKIGAFSLNEFLKICDVLGIGKQEAIDWYLEMHRERRNTGERWLFDSDKTPGEGDRRKMTVFASFAATSQFTQGRLGYRMHHLLHRPIEYQHRYAPEAFTRFDISRMALTTRETLKKQDDPKKSLLI